MKEIILGFGIAAVLLAAEYLLCTKCRSPLWGGILPLLILLGTVCLFASARIPLTERNIYPFIVLNVIMLSDWDIGRKKYKKLRQAELDKMKAKDI